MGNTAEKREVATIKDQAVTPMQMLQIAVQQGQGLDQIRELMQLEREWKADKAREAFYTALAEFKKVPVKVVKDKDNRQYGSKYASIGSLVNTVNAAMAPFDLNARWTFEQTDRISVTCILSHTLGHSESVTLSGAPDASGSKNPLQQIKSTITYLEIATFQAVTGVVAIDGANADDDGNSAGEKTLTPEQVNTIAGLIAETGADFDAFLKWAKSEALEDIPAKNFNNCIAMLNRKKAKK